MRRIIATIGATLAMVVVMATSAAPAGANCCIKIDNTGDGVEDVAYRWNFPQRG
jgi:hypothetical protein